MGLFDSITNTLKDNPLSELGIGTSAAGGLLSLFSNQKGGNEANAIKLLQDNLKAAKEGFTDANGNKISYVPGKGWVTQMADKEASAQDANITHNNMNMAAENTQAADALRTLTSTDIANILSGANRVGNQNALDKSVASAVRNAGTGSNIGSIIGGMTEANKNQMADTEANALSQALLGGAQINTNRIAPYIANAANLSSGFKADKANLNNMTSMLSGNMNNANSALASATATQDPSTSFLSKFGSALQGVGMGITDLNKVDQNKKQSQAYGNFLNNYSAGNW